jgi:hypothetical protein
LFVKFWIVATMTLFCSLAFGQANPGPNVVHANGLFAFANTFENGTSTFLTVTRGTDASGEPTTFLFLSMFTLTPDGFITTFSNGFVPNDMLRGDNPAHIQLMVDTSQIPGFFSTTCTFVFFPNFTQSCTNGPLGVIDLEWKQDGSFSTHSVSTTQVTFPLFTMQSHGESDTASGTVNGSILGSLVVNVSANSGVNHNVTLTLTKN